MFRYKIALMGDVMLGRLVNEVMRNKNVRYVWGDFLPELLKADLRILNLECVISDRGDPWGAFFKAFHFRASPKAIEALKAANIDFVSLANNHSLDYGEAALLDCLRRLKEGGIHFAGAGRRRKDAVQPARLRMGDLSAAIFSCTDNMPEWEAGEDSPGVFYLNPETGENTELLFDAVRKVRGEVDFLILSIHWGPNMRTVPSPGFRRFAHEVVDAGVDLLYGHSAHVFQGIEIYKGRPILYDTGDFIDDYAVDPHLRNDWGFLFLVHLARKKVSKIIMQPSIIDQMKANRAPESEAHQIVERMQNFSAKFGTEVREERGSGIVNIQ